MGIFATLHKEHILIREQLDQMTQAVGLIEENKLPPRDFFDKSLEFGRTYTNKHHHFKEEYLLFSQLAQKYEGSIDAVVEKLRNQHELGQNHLSDLSANLGGYERGESECVSKVRHHLSEFVRLMEVHIFAEDAVFFNMAKELMSQEEQDALQSGFEAYENGQGEDPTPRCKKILEEARAILESMKPQEI